MCGIAGLINLAGNKIESLGHKLSVMSKLVEHRGPDGCGQWLANGENAGFAHRRLSIIDLSEVASQPMVAENNTVLTYNGEIYNFRELRKDLSDGWNFKSNSDTEVILAAYAKYGSNCVNHFRGMFSFALWDESKKSLFCARDRFGIKPFYYSVVGDNLILASEAKAILPFLPEIATDPAALAEYLTFQYTIGEHTLFKGVKQLLPAHFLVLENGIIKTSRYWDVQYEVDYDHNPKYFTERLRELVDESVKLHLRSDVPVGSYLSGGIDSSLISLLASSANAGSNSFHGMFTQYDGYNESHHAKLVAQNTGSNLHIIDIQANDFKDNIEKVLYHLDFPIAGPGSFPQYMVSKLASAHNKVVLGGQGGDEIFGGYARYVVAYLEQSIKAAIDGTYKNGNYVVTIESIIPNLGLLREYKPMIKEFWREGLFDSLDERYFRLVDRSTDMEAEINWENLDKKQIFKNFKAIFNNRENVKKEAYFDSMTHFDFKCLLPALLHVEDRMAMAHGLESRVPLLDHPLVEFAATVPADVKFEGGNMKQMLKSAYKDVLPMPILERRDKMGFPVPLKEWLQGDLHEFAQDIFLNMKIKNREFVNVSAVLSNFDKAGRFSRKTWALMSLELWHQQFHDKANSYKKMLK